MKQMSAAPQYETRWPVSNSTPPLASSSSSSSPPRSAYGFPPPVSTSATMSPEAQPGREMAETSSTGLQQNQQEGTVGSEKPSRPTLQGRQVSQVREQGCSAWMHRAVSSRLQWAYLGVLALQAVIILALQGTIFGLIAARVSTSTNEMKAIQVYLAIFIFAEVYQLALAFDALRLNNTLQLYGLLLFEVAMLAYAALMPDQLKDALDAIGRSDVWHIVKGMLIAIPIVLGVSIAIVAALTYVVLREMDWTVFKLLGASIGIKKMFFQYQILVTLLKFDVFFGIGFACQFIILVTGRATYELVLTIIGMPVLILILIIGAVSVRKESRAGMGVYAIGLIAAMVYFIWKLVRIYTARDANGRNPYGSNERSLTLFSAVTIALLAATMISSLIVLLNFDKGLKQALPSYSKGTRAKVSKSSQPDAEEDRVSID